MKTSQRPNIWVKQIVGAVVSGVLLGVLFLFIIATQAIPFALGGSAMVVASGSMAPALSVGDIIAVRSVEPGTVRVGDIVTFQPVSNDPTLVTHRVVSTSVSSNDGLCFITRGDANGADDEPIVADQIKGLYMYRIPAVGWVFDQLGGVSYGMVKLIAAALLVYAVWSLYWPGRTPKSPDR